MLLRAITRNINLIEEKYFKNQLMDDTIELNNEHSIDVTNVPLVVHSILHELIFDKLLEVDT